MSHSATSPAPITGDAPEPRGVRVLGLVVIVVGLLLAVAGVVTCVTVQQALADQKIAVADDAGFLAGGKVDGPFGACAQTMVIGEHAEGIAGDKTYAELDQDDPARATVMTASFLQASLFTSAGQWTAWTIPLGDHRRLDVRVSLPRQGVPMRSLKSVVSATAIALMLVVSIDHIAFAATGKSLILGKSNSANKVTKLTRTTSGPAMQFNVKNGTGAPIKVNSKGRVGKLNADMVDSKHASDLGVNTSIYTFDTNFSGTSSFDYTVPSVAAGSYLVTFDGWIYGPSGAELHCGISLGHLWQQVPDVAGNVHFPMSTSAVVTKATAGDIVITCYSNTTGAWTDYADVQVTLTQITTAAVVPRPATKAPKTGDPAAAR